MTDLDQWYFENIVTIKWEEPLFFTWRRFSRIGWCLRSLYFLFFFIPAAHFLFVQHSVSGMVPPVVILLLSAPYVFPTHRSVTIADQEIHCLPLFFQIVAAPMARKSWSRLNIKLIEIRLTLGQLQRLMVIQTKYDAPYEIAIPDSVPLIDLCCLLDDMGIPHSTTVTSSNQLEDVSNSPAMQESAAGVEE